MTIHGQQVDVSWKLILTIESSTKRDFEINKHALMFKFIPYVDDITRTIPDFFQIF